MKQPLCRFVGVMHDALFIHHKQGITGVLKQLLKGFLFLLQGSLGLVLGGSIE